MTTADEAGDRMAGVLLGTALGDALGLPMEGMGGAAVQRRFPRIEGFALLGSSGFCSDDTEQSALVAQSLARHPGDRAAAVRAFRRAILGWFLRLPWCIGLGTLRACVRILFGFRRSGVRSAGNGAAMRAAIVGAVKRERSEREAWSDAFAEVTHVDPRAVQGARFVAELTGQLVHGSHRDDDGAVGCALDVVDEENLRSALVRARELAASDAGIDDAATELGVTGFVVHSVPLALFCFLRSGSDPMRALTLAIHAGGDTDTNAAIVGAWLGARHGLRGLPAPLVARLQGGPFGRAHLEALARSLHERTPPPHYAALLAFARNLALFPVVLAHAVRVMISRVRSYIAVQK